MQYKRSRHLQPELLDTLVALHEHGNFKVAARSLNVTQSAVSQRLGRLEATLGVPLMMRREHVALTPAGMRVLRYAMTVRELALCVRRELDEEAGDPIMTLPDDAPCIGQDHECGDPMHGRQERRVRERAGLSIPG
ncbi:MAG: LysR family transcriptional regulator [Pseudomonadota bacterium]